MAPVTKLEKRLRWSGLLIAAGLAVQLVTLMRLHPLAFVVFLCVACPLMATGIVLFLWTVVHPPDGHSVVSVGDAPPRT
jgi:hypothetical protein